VNISDYWTVYNAMFSDGRPLEDAVAMPSSGLLGAAPAAARAPPVRSGSSACRRRRQILLGAEDWRARRGRAKKRWPVASCCHVAGPQSSNAVQVAVRRARLCGLGAWERLRPAEKM